MQVNRVQKKIRLNAYDLVKYQIITELIFFKKEHLIASDIELLTLLALWGPMELGKFCNAAAKKIYDINAMEEFAIRSQNIRNRISKLQSREFVVKTENKKDKRKLIQVNPALDIHKSGNVLLNYNFLSVETTKA